MKKMFAVVAVFVFLSGSTGCACAAVIFSNMEGDSFSLFSPGHVVTPDISRGFAFGVSGNFLLSSIELEVANVSSFLNNYHDPINFSIGLFQNGTNGYPATSPLLTRTFSILEEAPVLLAWDIPLFPVSNGLYWLIASVDVGTAVWYSDSQMMDFGTGYMKTSLGGVAYPAIRGAFAVEGTAASVPEPATIFLLGAGLVGLFGSRRTAR